MISSASHSDPPRIAMLVPDGVGVRNFVLGQFLRQAAQACDVEALHIIPEASLPAYREGIDERVQWSRLLDYPDRPLSYVLRQALSMAQMYWVDNFPLREARTRPILGSWKSRAAKHVAKTLGWLCAKPARMRWLDRAHRWAAGREPETAHYVRLFRELQPDALFCTHQRAATAIAPVLAANRLGIPTATFIFSWDNLSSKGRIAAPFDHYFLWSEHMRQELFRFYPDVTPEQTHVVGTPQFDPYGDPDLVWSREEFFRRIGADPSRPLICYSGGDVGNSREDHLHVRALLELIAQGRIQGRPQVLLRPAPVDNGERYASVRRDFPELIYAPAKWLYSDSKDWAAVMPLPEDIQLLANLTRHADLNVNFASTMTLDFAIHDKPVINVVIDLCQPPSYEVSQWDFVRQFEHYQPVIDLGAARFAHSVDQLAEHVNAYLANPALDREGRRKFVELEVSLPVGSSCRRIVDALLRIAGKPRRCESSLAAAETAVA